MDASLLLRAVSFASVKHRNQRRKDAEFSPYINHPIAVASVLATECAVADMQLLIAAILHDTVEDTETTFDELREHFGPTAMELVRELTDDKSLPKAERKRLQIEHAHSASPGAKQLKIADKICNIRDILANPPAGWSLQRRREYLEWAAQVVDACRGVNPCLEKAFDAALAQARRSVASHS
jgi:GTP diphosphokinase / guanosine-3',5'-bis(diphosphate) 3'-diphosphatase